MSLELSGAVVALTGASRGIGAAIARDLAGTGARLVLAARDATGLEATAGAVRAAGGEAHVVAADLASSAGRGALVAAADAIGPVDALINNAGIEVTLAFADQTEADIAAQIALNLEAPLDLTRRVLPGMIARGRGAVVSVSSMSGKAPTPYNAVYTATKHGLVGFTSSLRIELSGTGVSAGVVCPGFVAEEGMWASFGLAAPRAMRAVPLSAVTRAVRAALAGRGEVLVTAAPVRPLLALGQLVPGLDAPMLRALGVLETLKERARRAAAARG